MNRLEPERGPRLGLIAVGLLLAIAAAIILVSSRTAPPSPAAAPSAVPRTTGRGPVGQPAEPGGAPALALERTVFAPGEPIRVRFVAPRYADDAWIGVIPSEVAHGDEALNDQHDVSYQYLSGRTSGELTFVAPRPGRWDLRLHTTDRSGVETASVSFSVQPILHDLTGVWIAEDGSRCRVRQVDDQLFWLCDERKGSEGPVVAHGVLVGRTATLRLARIPAAPTARPDAELRPPEDPLVGGAVVLSVEGADALRATEAVPAGFAPRWQRTPSAPALPAK